jgi:anti-sigma regulatory factor (Ser/Thr protein kinase)
VTDQITLTIPRERPFHGVAHLVLGGLASRLNLTLEALEDLELALDELLEADYESGDVTVELRVQPESIETEIGPFDGDRLRETLEREQGEGSVGLSRVLATVVDSVELVDRDGKQWIRLSKAVAPAQEVA